MSLRFLLAVTAVFSICLPSVTAAAGPVIFVNHAAGGANDGSSWTDAYTSLQTALASARLDENVRQIWVARGTYRPAPPGGDRAATFLMVPRVAILGGFAGNETEERQRNARTNLTVLSGDLNGDDALAVVGGNCCVSHPSAGCVDLACTQAVCALDPFCCDNSWDRTCVLLTECACGNLCSNRCDNSYHVVTAQALTGSAVLDGFFITAGNANGGTVQTNRGGAMVSLSGGPMIINCTFQDNRSASGGGAIYQNGTLRVVNSRFLGNLSAAGGAVLNDGGSPTFVNCIFSGNGAGDAGGGAMLNLGASATIVNCTFSENQAGAGGGIRNQFGASAFVANSIFWRNSDAAGMSLAAQIRTDATSSGQLAFSIVQGIADGVAQNVFSRDPLFVRPRGVDNQPGTLDDDLRLQPLSPAIDAGSNKYVLPDFADLDRDGDRTEPTPVDLDGQPRFFDDPDVKNTGQGPPPIVDLGAYEVASDCNRNGIVDNLDVDAQTSLDCNGNRIPDECEIRESSTAPGGPYFCQLDCNRDCDNNGIPDDCQVDSDADGVIDLCDECPGTPTGRPVDARGCTLRGACCFAVGVCFNDLTDESCELVQGRFLGYGLTCNSDEDGDGVRGCADRCPEDPLKSAPGICGCGIPDTDTDGDGVPDCIDPCPLDNPDDADGDGLCDSEDPCPNDMDGDTDGDGVCDSEDPCPFDNPDDTDGDGVCDSQDGCPLDPLKTAPGICGCGTPDTDSDQDGVADCVDACPNTPADLPVDEFGCPAIGACCFPIGVCVSETRRVDCKAVGGIYQGNRSLCAEGCSPRGDLDHSGRIDLADYKLFLDCMTSGTADISGDCDLADFDVNGFINLRDVAGFQNAFTGPAP